MKTKKIFSIGILASVAFIVATTGIVYAAFATRPWEDGGWSSLPFSTQLSQTNSWIASNISQRDTLTTAPWDEAGYTSLTDAQQKSKQRDWQYMQRRVSDEYEVSVSDVGKKIINSHSTREYFIPEKTTTEWDSLYNAIIAGDLPDLSLEDLANLLEGILSVGHRVGCAVANSGRAYCWGDNTYGNLGNGTSGTSTNRVPVEVAGGYTDWEFISGYYKHSCGIRAGQAYCWGKNTYGTIGDGTTIDKSSPALVSGGYTDWVQIDTESEHTCGLRATGQIYCWGKNTYGTIGDGTTIDKSSPALVSGGYTDWEQVAVGSTHACGIRSGGDMYCWGYNRSGEIGDGTIIKRPTPTLVSGGHSFTQLRTYGDSSGIIVTCGLTTGGQIYCWGGGGYSSSNHYGEIGDGSTTNRLLPTLVSGGYTDWVSLGAACAVRSTGQAYCWGDNGSGAIGDGTTTDRYVPQEISGGYTDWVYVTREMHHGCGYRTNGNAYCWGKNWFGQLGNNSGSDSYTPVTVSNLTFEL